MQGKMDENDIETDVSLTHPGTAMVTSHDYSILQEQNDKLEAEVAQLKGEIEIRDGKIRQLRELINKQEKLLLQQSTDSSRVTVDELIKGINDIKDVGSKQVCTQQISVDGHSQCQPTSVTNTDYGSPTLCGGESGQTTAQQPQSAQNFPIEKAGDTTVQEVVSLEMLDSITSDLVKIWKVLARKLSVPQGTIEVIEVDNRNESVTEVVYQMLLSWRQSQSRQATVYNLVSALVDVGYRNTAHQLCQKFGHMKVLDDLNGLRGKEEQIEQVFPTNQQKMPRVDETIVILTKPPPIISENNSVLFPQQDSANYTSTGAFELFVMDFVSSKDRQHMKQFRKEMGKRPNLNTYDIYAIAQEMEWSHELKTTFKSDTLNNLRVWNVLDKWVDAHFENNGAAEIFDNLMSFEELIRILRCPVDRPHREDIVNVIKEHVKFGVIGPKMKRSTQYTDLSFGVRNKLIMELNIFHDGFGFCDCTIVAENLGLEVNLIRYLTSRADPGLQVIRSWETQSNATVGRLYDALMKSGAMKVVSILE